MAVEDTIALGVVLLASLLGLGRFVRWLIWGATLAALAWRFRWLGLGLAI